MPKRQDFAYGALILSISGFLVKLIGAIFKIPLTNLVGAAAMSYFTSAYSIYNLLLALATSGLPTGIAAMISKAIAVEHYKDIKKILKIAAGIFVTVGAVLSIFGFIFAEQIAVKMNSEEAYWSVAAIMPAIFCISVVSVFKGYFQGYKNMAPTATSNLIEAAVKLIAGYGIAWVMFQSGYPKEQVVGGAVLGVSISTIVAMLYMILRYVFRNKEYRVSLKTFVNDKETPTRQLTAEFLTISFPIIISSVTSNLMSTVDAFLVMDRLKTYVPLDTAKLLWGAYGNLALTIFNLPSFLIIAIGISLIPAISSSYAKKDIATVNITINKAMRYSSILAFACAFGLYAVSNRTLLLFFPGDPEGVQAATPLLEIISFALIAVGLTNITSAVLQAIGKAYLPVISVAVGAGVKTISTFILVSIPSINVSGAPIATNIAYPIMLILNLWFIYKNLKILPNFMDVFVKPLISGIVCFIAAKVGFLIFDTFLPQKISLFAVILCAMLSYFAFILLIKLVTIDEIKGILAKNKNNP